MTFQQLLLEETEEEFEPVPFRLTAPPTNDVTTNDDVTAIHDVTAVAGQPMQEEEAVEGKNKKPEQIYLKVTDLGDFSSGADKSSSVTYSEVMSSEAERGGSSGGYLTLTEHLSNCTNNNNNNSIKTQHVCTSGCGYVEKENLPHEVPCT